MKKLNKHFAAMALMLASAASHAGSPGGLQLLVLGAPDAAEHQQRIAAYFAAYEADPAGFGCNQRPLQIDNAHQQPVKNATPEMALAAVASATQRKKFSRAMEKFRDPDHDRGFDGALLYAARDGKLKLYGISAWTEEAILVSTLGPADWSDPKKFKLGMCRVLQMPVLQEP